MYNVRQVKDDIYWVGGNDRRIPLFENVYPIPRGVFSLRTSSMC